MNRELNGLEYCIARYAAAHKDKELLAYIEVYKEPRRPRAKKEPKAKRASVKREFVLDTKRYERWI